MSDVWPLAGLVLATSDLTLRPLSEADLPELAASLPDDVALDPSLPEWPGLDEAVRRAVAVRQGYWRALGQWTPQSWRLGFAAFAGDRLVGTQELEGEDFLVRRTVDSSSQLQADVRGRGWGKQMRRAVLALAFGPLAAELAITSAWHHNKASLGVSRALGYTDNGISRERREDGRGADVMIHLRLDRQTWQSSGQAAEVTISGFEPCRPLFGL